MLLSLAQDGITIIGPVDIEDVRWILQLLHDVGCRAWVGGGWGVDALLGHKTREHSDLDLAIPMGHIDRAVAALDDEGFDVVVDWRPVRIAVGDGLGREVDLHPVEFQPDGSAVQAGLDDQVFHYRADGFTWGVLHGHRVRCLSAEQQLVFRQGYKLRPEDEHDIALLHSVVKGEAERSSV